MASLVCLLFALLFIVIMSSSLPTTSEVFAKQSPMSPSTKPMEKLTQLHFYFHNNKMGEHPTARKIVEPPKGSIADFGSIYMMDDPLTEGLSPTSKLVGRSQGLYAEASQHELGLLMVTNLFFTEGIYNGSTLSILGRNPMMQKVKEMPIVGGSGIFRCARGSAVLTTYVHDAKAGVAIVEYNVSVLHV